MEIRVFAPCIFPKLSYVIDALNSHPISCSVGVKFVLLTDPTLEGRYRIQTREKIVHMHYEERVFHWQHSFESLYRFDQSLHANFEFVGLVRADGDFRGSEDFLAVDVIATHFFASSRVEEYFFPRENLDSWGLMPENLHLAVRDGIHQIPYLDLNLRELLRFLGLAGSPWPNDFDVSVSYDFDVHRKISDPVEFVRTLLRLAVKNPFGLLPYTKDLIKSVYKWQDPYDIRKVSLARGTPCFLIVGGNHPFDPPISEKSMIQAIISDLEAMGCIIGFHPSYLASVTPYLFEEELSKLQSLCSLKVAKMRSHFLHQDPRVTPFLIESAGLLEDWTMGYNTEIGFRAGTCFPYQSFDLFNNCGRDLRIVPFSLMDSAVWYKAGRSVSTANWVIRSHVKNMQKWGLPIQMVFHNSVQIEQAWLGIQYPKKEKGSTPEWTALWQ